MKTSAKSILPLLIVIISICTGTAISNGENVTVDPNVTIPMSAPVVTPGITIIPNETISIPMSVVTPGITITPNVTVSIPMSLVTPGIQVTPDVAAVSTPVTDIIPAITAIADVTVPVPTSVVVPTIIATPVATTVSTPVTDVNVIKETISKVVPAVLNVPKPTHTPGQKPDGSKQTTEPIATTGVPTNGSNQNGFLGDIYDKIIIGAILGLVGLFYEIIKITYENKQKTRLEKINEDTQNKLLEKLEKRQEKLLAEHGISRKQHDATLDKSEKQQEDINDQSGNT